MLDKLLEALADSDAALRASQALVGTLWDVQPRSGPPLLSREQQEERFAAKQAAEKAASAAKAQTFVSFISKAA